MTPNETAQRILDGQLAPSQMKFSDFRWAMINEHPEYVSDDEIHDLYVALVVAEHAVTPEERLLIQIFGSEALRDGLPEPSKTAAVDQAIAQADAQRPSVDEVRKVAERKPKPVRYSKKSRRKKKNLGDVTLREVFVDGPKRASKRMKSSRRSRKA